MKKTMFSIICISVISIGVIFTMNLTNDDLSKTLGVNLIQGEVVGESDTHGWMGDGEAFTTIKFTEDDLLIESIEKSENWHQLPLSDSLQTFIYQSDDDSRKNPEIENGYYFFYDRHSESVDNYDDSDLLNRSSFNFTFAIYDTDNNMMYVLECDS